MNLSPPTMSFLKSVDPNLEKLKKILHLLQIDVYQLEELEAGSWLRTPGKWYYAQIHCNGNGQGDFNDSGGICAAYHCTAITSMPLLQREGLKKAQCVVIPKPTSSLLGR